MSRFQYDFLLDEPAKPPNTAANRPSSIVDKKHEQSESYCGAGHAIFWLLDMYAWLSSLAVTVAACPWIAAVAGNGDGHGDECRRHPDSECALRRKSTMAVAFWARTFLGFGGQKDVPHAAFPFSGQTFDSHKFKKDNSPELC